MMTLLDDALELLPEVLDEEDEVLVLPPLVPDVPPPLVLVLPPELPPELPPVLPVVPLEYTTEKYER
jgi:hypothetical protein